MAGTELSLFTWSELSCHYSHNDKERVVPVHQMAGIELSLFFKMATVRVVAVLMMAGSELSVVKERNYSKPL
jgi:hypothetical protein